MRPKPIAELGFDALFQVEDDDQPFYTCRSKDSQHAGREIGFAPTVCDSYREPAARDASVDRAVLAWEERRKVREDKEARS
jgi:hypothetical protein